MSCQVAVVPRYTNLSGLYCTVAHLVAPPSIPIDVSPAGNSNTSSVDHGISIYLSQSPFLRAIRSDEIASGVATHAFKTSHQLDGWLRIVGTVQYNKLIFIYFLPIYRPTGPGAGFTRDELFSPNRICWTSNAGEY